MLKQVGYSTEFINNALKQYQQFHGLQDQSDRAFVAYLRSSDVEQSYQSEEGVRISTQWYPSQSEMQTLLNAGYWQELIDNQLAPFLFGEYHSPDVVLSQFSLFRAFLRRRIPLEGLDINSWYPSKVLRGVVSTELMVEHSDYPVFFEAFQRAFRASEAGSRLIPKYFYNFIRKNQRSILTVK
ncbi:hypothetical protein HBA55_32310 [Pseudomaricurvus alkylphenolicus]|uniref:hypothetical protein n=1 Tax=Pseudomaricurvus alkylphenolicus TaxID=1306991 RepID=UPI001422A035|nr:hypothetical protein [Pseudomaricurvus alkylphenolicus]NIB44324.1 hypothetical protein [Pseudomaricurvus alkylphenolicus]